MPYKFLFTTLLLLSALSSFSQDQVQMSYSQGEGRLIRVTPPMSKAGNLIKDIKVRDEKGVIRPSGVRPITPAPPFAEVPDFVDQIVQKKNGEITPSAAIGSNFNGQGYNYVNPPDPSLAVGPNHVIQMINGSSGAYFVIYSKTGSVLKSQTYLDQITGRGGLGDPIVLYDQLADRFVMTEFANRSENSSEGLVVAVSQTANPTGSWYVYFFGTGTSFPDYPKFSVWNDGYYATSNDYVNNSYNGSTIYAFDRSRMLTGQSVTTYQQVKFSTTNFTKYITMCPVLLQGNTLPPAETGGLIAYMFDGSWTSTSSDADSVGLLEYRVNWSTPSASVLTNRSSLRAADFKSQICTASRGACIPQPGTTTRLEALEQKVMNQPIYRNFGNREGIVMTHVLDKGSNISAIRWYELQKTSSSWSINQQSTYSPDNIHRWMPSIAYDAAGNIALAYNVSDGSSVYPGIRYTGRKSCDPLNTMTYTETVIVNGTSRNGSSRYGDYSHLTADPNGQSFWFTGQWNNSLNWRTQITNFNLDNCGSAGCTNPAGLSSSNITSSAATLNWTAVSGATSYDVQYKTSASTTWINAATATTTTSFNLTGLTASTVYDWRVRTNCTGGSSGYAQAQFTTLATPVCNAPAGLSSSNITSSAATVSWTAVSGATSYDVQYKTSASATWINAATGTTATSVNLTALTASTVYDWRVRANCSSGSSSYTQSQFTTLAIPLCNAPAGLISSNVTSSAATVSWTAVSGANNYTIDYKTSASATWINAATGTTATSVNLTALTASTVYDWRVRANCSSGSSSYTQSQFTTPGSGGCSDPYEVNNTRTAAASVPVNTNLSALISSSTDADWFKFNNTSATPNIKVSLTNLAADYDIELYRDSLTTRLARSQNAGTTSETINYNTATVTQYQVRVYGYAGAFNATACYTLRIDLSGPAIAVRRGSPENLSQIVKIGGMEVYPNPANEYINIAFDVLQKGNAEIQILDLQGRLINKKIMGIGEGVNVMAMDVSGYTPGVYMVRILVDGKRMNKKIILQR
jgi:hypothetical protein